MRSSSGEVFAGSVDAPRRDQATRASRWAWVVFDPPLRDPRTMRATEFHVSCKICGRELGRLGTQWTHSTWRGGAGATRATTLPSSPRP